MPKTILITGASSGFGRLTAEKLHAKGHTAFGTSRNPDKHQTDFTMLPMDVRDNTSVNAAVQQLLDSVDRLDVIVNNAGITSLGPVEEHSMEDVQNIFETNLYGVHRVLKATLPQLRKQKNGRIINVTSLAGHVGTPNMGLYSVTKHALEGYTKSIAYELEPFGIEMFLVKPGEFKTEVLNNASRSSDSIDDYKSFKEQIAKAYDPNKPVDAPGPVADLIIRLIEDKKPKMHNRIGPFSSTIPIMNLFPGTLKKVTKKAYGIE